MHTNRSGFLVIPIVFATLGALAVATVIVVVVRSARLPSEITNTNQQGLPAFQQVQP